MAAAALDARCRTYCNVDQLGTSIVHVGHLLIQRSLRLTSRIYAEGMSELPSNFSMGVTQ